MTLGPFGGVNAGYVLELYERYRQNPESVDPATREAFESWTPTELDTLAGPKGPALPAPGDVTTPNDVRVVVGAANLAESIRRYGHLAARLDPLGSEPPGDPSLSTQRTRHHRRGSEEHCRHRSWAARSPSPRRTPLTRSRSCGASTARRPASTIRMCSCPRSATGCATLQSLDAFCHRWIRRAPRSCSIASRRSRCSSGSCTARSRARRASRSRAWTCWCRSSTRSSPARPARARVTRSSGWRIAAA